MADVINPYHLEHEARLANISSGGWRLLLEDSVTVPTGDAASYTIARKEARRVLLVTLATNKDDIRVDLNEAATANSLPLLPDTYITLSVEEGDVVHFFNTSAGALEVFIVELR